MKKQTTTPTIEELTKHLFIEPTQEGKRLYSVEDKKTKKVYLIHNGTVLPVKESHGIIQEAAMMKQSQLLIDLIKDIEREAGIRMYHQVTGLRDIDFGKGVLFATDLLKNKLDNLSKLNIGH